MRLTIGFACRVCGFTDLEAEVVIDSCSVRGCYSGPPDQCYPGEGAEWHVEADVVCVQCGENHNAAWMAEALNDEVQRRESEPQDPFDA